MNTVLSTENQVRLLSMANSRRTAMAAVLVIPTLLYGLHSTASQKPYALLPWVLGMACLALGFSWQHRRFTAAAQHMEANTLYKRWIPQFQAFAVLYGLAWTLPVLWLAQPLTTEFATLLYLVWVGVTAGGVVYISANLRVFISLVVSLWGVACLATFWVFPSLWHIVLPLSLLFVGVILRHGFSTHRFLVQQMLLEEHSKQLATQFKAAKEEAEQALRSKSQFLTTASHDLRQPVHAMGFLIESINQRNKDDSLRSILEDLRQSVRSMHVMFNALLDLSRIESGVLSITRQPVAIYPLFDDVCAMFREEAKHRGLSCLLYASTL